VPGVPEYPGGYVYGTILVATLLAAESPGRETYARTAIGVGLALVIYWLAISYAEYVSHRAERQGHFTLRASRRSPGTRPRSSSAPWAHSSSCSSAGRPASRCTPR
jgi:hypothetical protein